MRLSPLHDPGYSVLVKLIRDARVEAGVTQVDLAQQLGIDQSVISKIEHGQRRIDVIELKRFCDALHISLSDFVSRLEVNLQQAGL